MNIRPMILIATMLISPAITSAASIEDAENAIAEAEALRANEFSPAHFQNASKQLLDAREMILKHGGKQKIEGILDQAVSNASKASALAEQFSRDFAPLMESRDRLKLTGEEYMRDDLAIRSEKEFAAVVEAAESGNKDKAQRSAKIAKETIHAAQIVAAREQFVRPVSRAISEARAAKGRDYAPNAFNSASAKLKELDQIVRDDPDAQAQAYALSRDALGVAEHASAIADQGQSWRKNPGQIETWIDANQQRMSALAALLGIQLDPNQSSDAQLETLKQALSDMQNEHKQQLADADNQVRELGEKLAKYEGELAHYEGELSAMAEIRRKLQLKREAEAKIKKLAKLFDPQAVEILLTTDADVILRMKKLNFLSGSSVIPPEAYTLLDNAIASIGIFPDRAVRVEGHTDFMGTNEFNQQLSERRANVIREYLTSQIAESEARISAIGHGEEKPIANNETTEGRTKNRRIDIVLIAPAASPSEE